LAHNELTIETNGLRITISGEGDLWGVAKAAHEAAHDYSSFRFGYRNERNVTGSEDRPENRSARIRDIARKILEDGQFHERREIARAVRDAGLDDRQLSTVLKGVEDFEKSEMNGGRPAYRDLSVGEPLAPEENTYNIQRIEDALNGGVGSHE
jgi:hypothetical protein